MEADLTQRARLVPSHSLYLLHGLADLTAPYTHGVAFAKALSEAGVIFRYQVRDMMKVDVGVAEKERERANVSRKNALVTN